MFTLKRQQQRQRLKKKNCFRFRSNINEPLAIMLSVHKTDKRNVTTRRYRIKDLKPLYFQLYALSTVLTLRSQNIQAAKLNAID